MNLFNLLSDNVRHYDSVSNAATIEIPYCYKQLVKNFYYDGNGRVKAEQNPYFDTFSTAIATPSAIAAYTNYTYDALSRVTNVTLPDSTNISIIFDHWTVSAYDQNSHRKDYHLDAYDRIVKVTEHDYDPILGINLNYNTTYSYDAAAQLLQITDAKGNTYSFTYDSLGRRTRLNDPDIGEWNYTYDLAGNLISQAGGGGNLVTGDGFYREYNTLNQLIRIRNGSSINSPLLEEYTYDPYGERVKIWRNDTTGTVIYTPFRELMQIRNSSGVYNYSYIYDGSVLVARVNPDSSKQYYHPDHLGSTTLVTDSAGNVVEETFYEPYGDVTAGGSNEVKLYTGQFNDELTGQYYYGARYYKPTWGKFVQADHFMQNIYDPQLLNHYAYARNNPYKYTDPDGKIVWRVVIGKGTELLLTRILPFIGSVIYAKDVNEQEQKKNKKEQETPKSKQSEIHANEPKPGGEIHAADYKDDIDKDNLQTGEELDPEDETCIDCPKESEDDKEKSQSKEQTGTRTTATTVKISPTQGKSGGSISSPIISQPGNSKREANNWADKKSKKANKNS